MKNFLHTVKRRLVKLYNNKLTINKPQESVLPDALFLKLLYKKRIGKKLHLHTPRTFCEKENWLKLHDRNPLYTTMVDKYAVRAYIKERIGDEYLVPLLGVWDTPDEIDFSKLPNRFVLKCNHNSDVIICRDKNKFDTEEARKQLAKQLQIDYYKNKREWPYKNVKRKIICEEFMENTNGDELVDYKLFCFNGKVKFIMLNSNRFGVGGVHVDMYDMDWHHMDMQDGHYPMAGDVFAKPECFEEMCTLSRELAEGLPFIRVDFNYWNKKLYFGELTLYHSAGLEAFEPAEIWDVKLGDWLELPRKRRLGRAKN